MKQTPAHHVVNQELLALIPDGAQRVVEIGCMLGAMAQAWRGAHPRAEYVGVDIDPDYARAAAEHCTQAFAGDVERLEPAVFDSLFPSDCWIFGDCLEHLRDPWTLLRRIRERIDPQGCLLTCIPNAQHWSVQWRLASGQFRYEDNGLMDRTHIRWFTRITMLEMFAAAGWKVEQGLTRNLPASPLQEGVLAGIRSMAQASGFDPETAVRDALPFQYVFKLVPA
ncbi:class I SAM-dependent methyltransferase [Azohydromonas aeria]|uniref:class I SAM-dependent methyltransferase n=1 Tax=Azohydromonas aeria TaxID=2590212 RepID=UPI0012FC5CC2|nr:class I SAM-dependent methyltransferase [Azohydromonas aeria]